VDLTPCRLVVKYHPLLLPSSVPKNNPKQEISEQYVGRDPSNVPIASVFREIMEATGSSERLVVVYSVTFQNVAAITYTCCKTYTSFFLVVASVLTMTVSAPCKIPGDSKGIGFPCAWQALAELRVRNVR
jgi:hypothetical protein